MPHIGALSTQPLNNIFCAFVSSFISPRLAVDTKHIDLVESIGSIGPNWRLCKRSWAAHANGIRARFRANRQLHARHQSITPNGHATTSLSEIELMWHRAKNDLPQSNAITSGSSETMRFAFCFMRLQAIG